ncbi:E3 ubiquitin/ISG15 ligase TRIM25 isoform X2 [Pangasianodon hypophthalmus]|uniref:E3 ubiquitin/ISG15 ligase TRIM25 isoform X2 n=1 Tax=Pangasianodon hypophthalmus TaxID=310915 RepID=UPI0023079F8B|nr:E3 ubiquitin/ISG15 ligase TRIM25 isoform X2 [Pangasianodon hypophthalmus]
MNTEHHTDSVQYKHLRYDLLIHPAKKKSFRFSVNEFSGRLNFRFVRNGRGLLRTYREALLTDEDRAACSLHSTVDLSIRKQEMATKPSIIPLLLPVDELLCSICQTLLNDPVTIPCGHNFCKTCISTHWKLAFSSICCPHCRSKFPSKPDLKTNTILCAIKEHVEKVWPVSEDVSIPDEKQINCDICEEGRELSAVKTCVTCLASFCSVHATPHMNSQALAKHCLCTPVTDIKDLLCKKHSKVLEVFCMNHGTAICWQCTAKHRKCNTRSVEEMRTDWKDAAEKMTEDVQLCFEALLNTINHAQKRAISFIEAEKLGALQKIEKQKERLDDHMVSISLIKDKIDECLNNDSYFNFLLPLPQLPPEVGQLQDVQLDGQAVERMILDLQQLNSSLESQLSTMLQRREEIREKDLTSDYFRVVSGHSKRRGNLLKYSSRVTFDPVTASALVLLSEDGLTVTVEHSELLTWKDYQVNKEIGFRVLCSKEFSSGQHYWELQPPEDEDSNWAVGVTYKNSHDHYQSLGQDSSSWCVRWQNKGEDKDNDKMANNMEGAKDGEVILPKSLVKEDAVKPKVPNRESKKSKLEEFLKKDKSQEGLPQDENKRERNQALVEDVAEGEEKVSELTEENKTATQEDKNIPKQSSTGFFASHNQEMNLISQKPPGKIGVLLDCDRGWLSFFLVSDSKVRLCYRFQALFSAPLCPAIWLRDPESTMTISKGLETTLQ